VRSSRLRREHGLVESPTVAEFVDVYLAQHEGEPETVAKLRWLLAKAVHAFGEKRLSELRSPAIAAWRMTPPSGHRFEATQALRQVLVRGVSWGLLDVNPAKLGVEDVRRTFRNGRIKTPKTKASVRAVPLQAIVRAALDELPPSPDCPLLFPSVRGGHLDLQNFRNRNWKPAQRTAGIEPLRRVYDLRHTSRPSRSVPASPPSISPATWE